MRIVSILCHPQPGSLNHAVAERSINVLEACGHTVIYHDLYREAFDPILTLEEIRRGFSFDEQVQAHSGEVTGADGLVLIHPDWWGQPPALLKGWVDRVLRPGVAYTLEGPEFMKKRAQPLLTGTRAMVFASTDARDEQQPHLLDRLWREGVFVYCGIEGEVHLLYDAFDADYTRRNAWLERVEERLRSYFPAGGDG